MTKPKFGKWIEIKDGQILPAKGERVLVATEDGIILLVRYMKESNYYGRFEGFYKDQNDPDSEIEPSKWMPLPAPDQDAFTELRAKLEELENRYDKEVSAWSFDEILNEIREVIE